MSEATERIHHQFSPSKLGYLEACPAYESRIHTNKAAADGTKLHKITETGADDHSMDDDQAAAAAECMDYFARQKQLMIEARDREVEKESERRALLNGSHPDIEAEGVEHDTPQVLELAETYLPIDDERFIAPVWVDSKVGFAEQLIQSTTAGYFDRALIAHTQTYAEIYDWKFGKWEVEPAKTNLQGIAYALGFFRKYPLVQAVKMVFKQPALSMVSEHTFGRDEIPEMLLRVKTTVARKVQSNRLNNFSMARPLVPVCNFCGRLGECEKVLPIALKVSQKFFPMEIPESVTPTMVQDPVNSALGMRLAGVMTVWADAFKRTTSDRVIRRGCDLPEGYTLQKRSDRVVADAKKFLAVVHQFVTDAELAEIADYPFGKIEAIINEKAPRGLKTAKVKEFSDALFASGAVVRSPEYSFLRAVAERKEKTKSSDETKNAKA